MTESTCRVSRSRATASGSSLRHDHVVGTSESSDLGGVSISADHVVTVARETVELSHREWMMREHRRTPKPALGPGCLTASVSVVDRNVTSAEEPFQAPKLL